MRKQSQILLATTNPTKLQYLHWLTEGLSYTCVTPLDIKFQAQVNESGETHEMNARLKAIAWSNSFRGLTIASDGGVVIPALGDSWDNLRTARADGEIATDQDRVNAMLQRTRSLQNENRRIYWIEGLAIAKEGNVLASWEVLGAPGYLAEDYTENHFTPGFWLATLWYFPVLGKRYNQLSECELIMVDDHWVHLKRLVQEFFSD
jgi:inosine/xanthosine triphosphate pyrophosphatase family protein